MPNNLLIQFYQYDTNTENDSRVVLMFTQKKDDEESISKADHLHIKPVKSYLITL